MLGFFELIGIFPRYNFKLDLANCANMDAKSVAFKLMDVAVSSHSGAANNTAIMERVDYFIKERGLNTDSVYSEYCASFFTTFKPNNLLQSFKAEEKSSPALLTAVTVADLSWRACLVASRIKSIHFRLKASALNRMTSHNRLPGQAISLSSSLF